MGIARMSAPWGVWGLSACIFGCYSGLSGSSADGGQATDGSDETEGVADGTETEGDDEGQPIDPPPEDEIAAVGLRRLTAAQYLASLRDLVGDAPVDASDAKIQLLPTDAQAHGYSTMARGVSAAHVDAHVEIAAAVAQAVATDPDNRTALADCLATPPFADACLRELIDGFGRRAYRRPLTDAEVDGLLALHAEAAAADPVGGLEAVLMALTLAPEFIYRVELGEGEGVRRLGPYELASRLAFTVWGRGPDDALLDAAADGDLDAFESHVDRVFNDARTEAWVATFFDEHLALETIPPPPPEDTFLQGVEVDGLAEAMRAEVLSFAQRVVFEEGGSFATLLTDDRASVAHDGLAQIYGVQPAADVTLPGRAGLLTRAAALAGPALQTAPVLRGAAIVERFFCIELEAPDPDELPPDQPVEPPAFDPTRSTREAWEEKTRAAVCATCHEIVNGPGFALEGFDALGRERAEEVLYDAEGLEAGTAAIDDVADVLIDGEFVSVDGAVGLSKAIANSMAARDCFARRWLRFADGRHDAPEDDPVVANMIEAASVVDSMREVVLADGFRFVRTPDDEEEGP